METVFFGFKIGIGIAISFFLLWLFPVIINIIGTGAGWWD